MNEDFLDAECVIQQLLDLKVIQAGDWKNQLSKNIGNSVSVDAFKSDGSKVIVTLPIIKSSGRYLIPRSHVNILSYRLNFDAENIFSKCSIFLTDSYCGGRL